MAKKRTGVPVSERAPIQRINRKLDCDRPTARQSGSIEMLKTARGARAEHDLGRHYIIDLRGNVVLRKDVDIEELGRELGVLRPYEAVAE